MANRETWQAGKSLYLAESKGGAVKSVPGISVASLRVVRGTTESMRVALKRSPTDSATAL
jgi:hypothetical protein